MIIKEFNNNDKDELWDLCFMLDYNDFVIKKENSIKIISLFEEIKYFWNFKNKIISLIKIDKNKLCISFSHNYITIIELMVDDRNYKINYEAKLPFNAYNLSFLQKEESEILFSNNNSIYCIDEKQNLKEIVKENNNIILFKEFQKNQIIYLTEDNDNTFIHFIKLNNNNNSFIDKNNLIKETTSIENKKFNDSKNLVILKDYCILGFEKTIELIYYEQKQIIHTFFLENKLTNIIKFNNDKLMLALYDGEDDKENISIIRELIIEIRNNKRKVFVRGEGKITNKNSSNNINNIRNTNYIENNIVNEKANDDINRVENKKDDGTIIKNIIEINNSLILIKTKEGKLMTLNKKNVLDEIFKKAYNEYNIEK